MYLKIQGGTQNTAQREKEAKHAEPLRTLEHRMRNKGNIGKAIIRKIMADNSQ